MAVLGRADALADRIADVDHAGRADLNERLRDRFRVALCCLALTVLATATRPGRLLADTKIDMAVNPLGFLGRALHLWDAGQFGQLQNQAAGYFFPMGPFYSLGHLIGLPAWITQRLWLATLLCAAFLGTRLLAARLGIGGPVTRLFGGLAYALAPHGLSALGQNSWEYLPLAMLPWIVVPLVTAVQGGSRVPGGRPGSVGRVGTAAARSGVAVALCGGINATATVAVLVVPAIYVLTRPRGTPRLRILTWWSAAVGCAVAWWLVPLVLTGKYGFSWLGYTEKAGTTTAPTYLINVLRGTERWINYLGSYSLPVGNALSTEVPLILVTGALAALGLAGLLCRGLPERTFLLLSLLAGMAIITAGHADQLEAPLAAPVRELLDGPLAPLRNLYKFDGLVRLPLALGLVHLLMAVRRPRPRLSLFAAATATLAAVAVPALSNGLAAPGDFASVPSYWRQAASWLNGKAGEQAVLAIPGSRFGEYTWGRPMDDIAQPLLRTRWGARQLVPQGSPGYARLMNAIDERVSAGHGSAGLTEVLARMGVRYLLVRNDLSRGELYGAWPARVHEALDSSPGIQRVAAFGDRPAGGVLADEAVGAFDQDYAPVEIYEVAGAQDVVSLLDASQAVRLYGASDGLLGLADNGMLRGRPVFVDGDAPQEKGQAVTSDALRLRQRGIGQIRTQISPTLTAGQQTSNSGALVEDPADSGWSSYRTVAAYQGVRNVTASSSAADPDTPAGFDDPGTLPYAAVDGDAGTQWLTGGFSGPLGQWLRIDFDGARDVTDASVAFTQNAFLGPSPTRIAVQTEAGTIDQAVRATSAAQRLQVPKGRTRWLRIRITGLAGSASDAARVGVTELRIGGVRALRYLRVPAVRDSSAFVMTRENPWQPQCMRGSKRWVCSPQLARGDEEGPSFNRLFTAGTAAPARLTGTAVLTDPAVIERFVRQYGGQRTTVQVAASSTWTREAAGMPRSAFDGDPSTTWVASGDDRQPALTIVWGKPILVSEVTVTRPPGASPSLQLQVAGSGGELRDGWPDGAGRLRFAPMITDRLTLRFSSSQRPMQVSDVAIPGVQQLSAAGFARFTSACGAGPQVWLNGRQVPTRVAGTVGDLLNGRALRFSACGTGGRSASVNSVNIAAGENRLLAGGAYKVQSAVVDQGGRLASAGAGRVSQAEIDSWGPGTRTVQVDAARKSYLVVNENFNPGWEATIDGQRLWPVRLDGWRQAWEVPAGTAGTVKLVYRPDRIYRASLFGGLGLAVLLLLVAVRPRRRRPSTPEGHTGEAARSGNGAWTAAAVGNGAATGSGAGVGAGATAKVGATVQTVRRGVPLWVTVPLAAGLGFWLAGLYGVGILAVLALIGAWVRFVRSPWVVAVAMLLGVGVVAADAPQADVISQVLGLVVIGCLLGALAAPWEPARSADGRPARDRDLRWVPAAGAQPGARSGARPPDRRSPNRRAGFSTRA